jgi:hypothetical protein
MEHASGMLTPPAGGVARGPSPPPSGAGAGKGIANAQCGFVDERGSNASSTDSLRVRETCRDFLKVRVGLG